jgi:arylsulfatase B
MKSPSRIRPLSLLISLMLVAAAWAGNNVLLIIADDYGIDAQSLYNPTGITAPTPHINSLAAAGIRFSNAYACPVCTPSRATILTGRFGFRTGIGDVASSANALNASEVTLPEVISQTHPDSIACAAFGKWHLSSGTPNAIRTHPNTLGGWPHYAGSTSGALQDYFNWTKTTNGTNSNSTTYATTDVVNDAVAWINSRNASGQQWLAWVAFNAPHTPFHTPPAHLHSLGTNLTNNSQKYRAAVEAMDTEIGRLLLSINPSTTDIIFIGDNGTPAQVAQAPFNNSHAKDTLYEGGIRVPFIIKGPSVTASGRIATSLVHVVDLFATLLDLAGLRPPSSLTLDSQSLRPILQNQADTLRSRIYVEQFDQEAPATGGRTIRDDRYKLIRFPTGVDQLFDLLNDLPENNNLLAQGVTALSPTHRDRYHRLRFNLGAYTSHPASAPLSHTYRPSGFVLSVQENPSMLQSMWHSSDLDYWKPVTAATRSTANGQITFTDATPLPDRTFYSILAEAP